MRKLISRRKDKPWEREINDHQSLERRLDDEKDTTGIRILQTTPNEFMLGESLSNNNIMFHLVYGTFAASAIEK